MPFLIFMMQHTHRFAQMLGLFCAIVACGILLMFATFLAVTGAEGATGVWVFVGLSILAALGGWAAYDNRPFWLLISWFISFVPAGFWLMLMPSWVRLAGFAQLGMLVAAVLMFQSAKQNRNP